MEEKIALEDQIFEIIKKLQFLMAEENDVRGRTWIAMKNAMTILSDELQELEDEYKEV